MPSAGRIALDFLARPESHRYGWRGSQRGELWLPEGDGPHPAVVVIHGGSWRAKYGKAVMKPVCADLVRHGLAAWNIEYRRIGRGQGGGWPRTFDDVAAAIDILPVIARERLDLRNVAILGHSAGGQLALWAAARKDSGVRFRRAVSMAGVCDMASSGGTAADFLGGSPGEVPERYDFGDPIRLVPIGIPIRLIHGADDATVPQVRSRAFMDAARAAGDSVELIEPVPGGHRVHIDPRSHAWAAAMEFLAAA
jgi:acetyl esterase/lipase